MRRNQSDKNLGWGGEYILGKDKRKLEGVDSENSFVC